MAVSVALAAPCLLVLGLLVHAVVHAARSPLRRIPGPALSLFTSASLRWHELCGQRTRYVHSLHQAYGPAVRLAPDEVSFSSAAAVKDIYNASGSGFDKTEFYDLFQVYGRRTMFATLEKEKHARRRRILADRYANSNIMRGPALAGIEERSRHFADLCQNAHGGVLDIYIDSLRKESDAEIMREVTFDDSLQNRLIKFYSPALYAAVGSLLALFTKPRDTPKADNFVLDTSAKTDTAGFTLLARMHEKQQPYPPPPSTGDEEAQAGAKTGGFDALDAAAESLDHMAAGIDTTGDALCFLMWELSTPRSRRFQERLRRELLDNAARGADAVAFDRLPFLDAVVMEGLRCFPAIPMSLPRVVPGRPPLRSHASTVAGAPAEPTANGRVVDGHFLPAGTVVSSQAFSVHRMNAGVFPDPDTFNPERWLASDGDADRKRCFFAFASGGRGCIGKHLALVEMKILLRDIYARFATAPDISMTQESMGMSDQLISSRPLGQKCLLQFVRLDEVSP